MIKVGQENCVYLGTETEGVSSSDWETLVIAVTARPMRTARNHTALQQYAMSP